MRDHAGRTTRGAALVILLLVHQACGAGSPAVTTTPPSTPGSSSPTTPPVLPSPSVDGLFPVDEDGRRLAMTCWGTEGPTVVLESGGGGLDEWSTSGVVRRLASQARVCLYNRAGLAPSDPAPNRPREAEDVAADFQALMQVAGVDPPYVLLGRSFGGMIVAYYASVHPEEVTGVVIYDSPAPSATMTIEDFPEGVWDAPGSLEHLNVLTGFENRFGRDPVEMQAPLILLSPTNGETTPDDRYWLQTSPKARQLTLEGDMDLIDTQPQVVADAVLSLVGPDPSTAP